MRLDRAGRQQGRTLYQQKERRVNPETKIQNKILIALSNVGCVVWRNETAGAWVGKVIHKEASQVTLANARMIRFGIAIGSSDIIGITPEGRFLAIEVKTQTGRPSQQQLTFIDAVRQNGGVAGIARSVQDALDLIGG